MTQVQIKNVALIRVIAINKATKIRKLIIRLSKVTFFYLDRTTNNYLAFYLLLIELTIALLSRDFEYKLDKLRSL